PLPIAQLADLPAGAFEQIVQQHPVRSYRRAQLLRVDLLELPEPTPHVLQLVRACALVGHAEPIGALVVAILDRRVRIQSPPVGEESLAEPTLKCAIGAICRGGRMRSRSGRRGNATREQEQAEDAAAGSQR